MAEKTLESILIVEDDLDVAEMLTAYFQAQGYQVQSVNWGEDGVRACQEQKPDLLILDIRLPDIDGFEVAGRLRAAHATHDLPIIFLTEKRERMARLHGLSLRAEDYITKPFDIQELRLKVRNALSRARRGALENPVTGLPEAEMVDEKLVECLKNDSWALVVVSLENVAHFRDAYGFVAADDLLKAVALMLKDCLRAAGRTMDFLGQLSAVDFIISTVPEQANTLKELAVQRLDQSFPLFYRQQDLQKDLVMKHRLSVQASILASNHSRARSLAGLRAELEQLYRKGLH